MPVPDYQTLMLPILKVLRDGSPRSKRDLADLMSDQYGLTPPERAQTVQSSNQPLIVNKVHWATYYMLRAGLLETTAKAVFKITARGMSTLEENPSRVDKVYLRKFEEFRNFYDNSGKEREVESPQPEAGATSRFWVLAAGSGGDAAKAFFSENVVAIGWELKKSLLEFARREDIEDALRTNTGKPRPTNDSLACFEFARVMKPGDIVFLRKGASTLIGVGRVEGDYLFEPKKAEYPHRRKVTWLKMGQWELPDGQRFGIKTLTDVSDYYDFIQDLTALAGAEELLQSPTRQYWWLNANPTIWDPRAMPLGGTQTYSTHTPEGNKRRIYKHFLAIRPGDTVLGYLASPHRELTCIFEVTKAAHSNSKGVEEVEFRKVQDLETPITRDELLKIPEVKNSEPLTSAQGSLFALAENEFNTILNLIEDSGTKESSEAHLETYTKEDALQELFLEPTLFDSMLSALRAKKNMIIQGPPGVGKTFLARRLAYAFIGAKAKDQIEMVQFHQSYSYEDFVQGYRPSERGTFERKNGLFYEFCREALRHPEKSYIFIIDEINRGNISRIFGELLMLIEPDKRGPNFSVPLTYADGRDDKFYVPENVFLVGLMNTADRGLALIDYALRRRFSFFDLHSSIGTPKFRDYLKTRGAPAALIKKISDRISLLNKEISEDKKNLGPGFAIGHSYFCPADGSGNVLDDQWFRSVIENEIASLLREYWFDDEDRVEAAVKKLVA